MLTFSKLDVGKRIAIGFALAVVVPIICVSLFFNIVSRLSKDMDLIGTASQIENARTFLEVAHDEFLFARTSQSVTELRKALGNFDIALNSIYDVIPELDESFEEIQTVRELIKAYEVELDQKLALFEPFHSKYTAVQAILSKVHTQADTLNKIADNQLVTAKQEVERIEEERAMVTQAGDVANKMMVALSRVRQIELELRNTPVSNLESISLLADAQFRVLHASIPVMRNLLPEEQRSIRKFQRWLFAFESAFKKHHSQSRITAEAPRVTASVLLQTDANRLYKKAVSKYETLQNRAADIQAGLNVAIEEMRFATQMNAILSGVYFNEHSVGSLAETQLQGSIEGIYSAIKHIESSPLKKQWQAVQKQLLDMASLISVILSKVQKFETLKRSLRALNDNIQRESFIVAERVQQVAQRSQSQQPLWVRVAIIISLSLAILLAGLIALQLVREMKLLSSKMRLLAAGQLDTGVPFLDRKDQTGTMAKALEVFRNNALKLKNNELFLESVIENLPNMVFVKEAKTLSFVRINKAGEQLIGVKREQLIGKNDYDMFPKSEADFFVEKDRKVLESGKLLDIEKESIKTVKQGVRYLHTKKVPIFDGDNEATYLLGISEDITQQLAIEEQLKQQQQVLRRMAHHDELTGLPNRVLLKDRMAHSIDMVERQEKKFAVLFVDLDRFKPINDSLGHAVGDQLLIQVAARLQKALRKCDTLARIGGDEFVVIVDQVSDLSIISVVSQKIITEVTAPYVVDAQTLFLGASIGVAICPDDGVNPETLLQNADAAMYNAKNDGGATFCFYSDQMTKEAFGRLQLETRLRQAIDKDQFEIFYQPQFDLVSNEIVGVEALLRWNDPVEGVILPDKFIPIVESTGLIVSLGSWVLSNSCAAMGRWIKQGLAPSCISINVSSKQLRDNQFLSLVTGEIEKNDLPAARVKLEITEGTIMENQALAVTLLKSLREHNVGVAMDDFGTGYSSLSYLKQLPISQLKIDRSFVCDLLSNKNDRAIAQSIIALGGALKLEVLAEGVELKEQAEFLRVNGCTHSQGYLHSEPLNEAAFVDFMKTHRVQAPKLSA